MLLLRDYGLLMVHFVGVPPGTADLLIKFVPPETLERLGGAGKYAEAVNDSLTRLGELLRDMESIRELLLGKHYPRHHLVLATNLRSVLLQATPLDEAYLRDARPG